MTVDASLGLAEHAGGSGPHHADGAALDPQSAAELIEELALLTRSLFTQLRSDAVAGTAVALRPLPATRAATPSGSNRPIHTAARVDALPTSVALIDRHDGAGPIVEDTTAGLPHPEHAGSDPLDLTVPSLALEDQNVAGEPATDAVSDLTLSAADVNSLDEPPDLVVAQAEVLGEDVPADSPDDQQHLDEDEPEVGMPHLAHVRDLRVLNEIRFLED